jgi:putative serine protease PepD
MRASETAWFRRWSVWAAAVGIFVVGGIIGGLIVAVTRSSGSSDAVACPATSVANRALPSVVTISASSGRGSGTGSGVVIRADGYVITNDHVIAIGADGGSVTVAFDDGHTTPATIVGRDTQTDLAVLKVVDAEEHLTPIALGSSENIKVGQPVVALGAPLGLSSTVTAGIVSALGRTVDVPADNGQTALLVSAIQTDASINPGNSGGALVDCAGRLIGVNTAGATVPNPDGQPSAGSVGLNFAIPVDFADLVANEIIDTGGAAHAYLGLQAVPIPASAAGRAGVVQGLFVTAVAANGPAAHAGLRAGDVLTQIDGQAASNRQLTVLELTKRAGDNVTVTYRRAGQDASTTITLTGQP